MHLPAEEPQAGPFQPLTQLGRTPHEAVDFRDGWMLDEEPFLAAERPWTRAHLVVHDTPPVDDPGDGRVWVAAGPAATARAGR